ncbi:hypothetical protein BsWGS_22723 [Bradybaena similaris]
MNSTVPTADSEPEHLEVTLWLKVPMVIYLLAIHFFGVASNIVAAIIYGRTSPKSACDYLILTMSITDAFVCFCSPVLYIRSYLRIPFPWKTTFVCSLEYWLQLTAMFASCMLLTIIAQDRYVRICRPALFSFTPAMARNACVITLLISAVVCLVPFLGRTTGSYCYIGDIRETTVTKAYFTSMFCCFVVSFCIVTFAYVSVCQKISQKIKLKRRLIEKNGLNLSAGQGIKEESISHQPQRSKLWSQLFSSWPAKWKISLRLPDTNEAQNRSSCESLYSNENINKSSGSKSSSDKLHCIDDNENVAFLNTDLKINTSTTEIAPRIQTENLTETSSNRWLTSEAKKAPAVNVRSQAFTAVDRCTSQSLVIDSNKTVRLDSEASQVVDNNADMNDGISLQKYGRDKVVHTDIGANPLAPYLCREPAMNNYVSSCERCVIINWNSVRRVSVSDSDLLHTDRYLSMKGVSNYADDPHRRQKLLTLYPYHMHKGDNCILEHEKGNKHTPRRYYSSFCLLSKNSLLGTHTADITNMNGYIYRCDERNTGFWCVGRDNLHDSHLKRNNLEGNENVPAGLSHHYDLRSPNVNKFRMERGVSRLFSSCTTRCPERFQNSSQFFVNMDACSLYCLATNNHRQRLVKSDPCLLLRPSNGNLPTPSCQCRDPLLKPEIMGPTTDPKCAFRTNCSLIEKNATSQEPPHQSPSSMATLFGNFQHLTTDFPQKITSFGGSQSALQLDPSIISPKDVPNAADELQRVPNRLEQTNVANVLLHRPRSQTALKPTGSTSSRRSNKSSSFADPVKTLLMVDRTDADDSSEFFTDVAASPSAVRRIRMTCSRISVRSKSSVKSTASSKIRFARERQITMMLLSVTAAFLLSWVPPWTMYMTCLYGPLEYSQSALIQYLETIHLLNFVASPVIYFTFNPTFRSKVSQLLSPLGKINCCGGKHSSQPHPPDNSTRI